jgi:hypothetical protein
MLVFSLWWRMDISFRSSIVYICGLFLIVIIYIYVHIYVYVCIPPVLLFTFSLLFSLFSLHPSVLWFYNKRLATTTTLTDLNLSMAYDIYISINRMGKFKDNKEKKMRKISTWRCRHLENTWDEKKKRIYVWISCIRLVYDTIERKKRNIQHRWMAL